MAGLPTDVWFRILGYSDIRTLAGMHAVSRDFNYVAGKSRKIVLQNCFVQGHQRLSIMFDNIEKDFRLKTSAFQLECLVHTYAINPQCHDHSKYINYGKFLEGVIGMAHQKIFVSGWADGIFSKYGIPKPLQAYRHVN